MFYHFVPFCPLFFLRDSLLSSNKGSIDGLFDKRRAMELAYMAALSERSDSYQSSLDSLVVQDCEEHNKLKIRLETDVQTLEQQLEEMRATYQLNTEKLEYNFRVLSERDTENTSTLQKQKKKLAKIKDDLSRVVLKYRELDVRDRKKNEELSEDYRRITEQYKDLQAKFRHFEVADNRKFEEVWSMHEEEVNKFLDRALEADRIINEQQLGWRWQPADLEIVRNPALMATGPGTGPGTGNPALTATGEGGSDGDGKEMKGKEMKGKYTGGSRKYTAEEMQAAQALKEEEEEAATVHVPADKIRSIVSLISEEAGFLLDADVKKAIDSLVVDNPAAASMAQAEALLKALGVDNESDLVALSAYFFVDVDVDVNPNPNVSVGADRDPGADAAPPTDPDAPEDTPEALSRLQKLIQPNSVIAAINSFVNDRKEEASRKSIKTFVDPAAASGAPEGEKKPDEEKEFWNRMSSVVSSTTHETWKHLETALTTFNKTLVQRSSCISRVTDLGNQNEELKALLNQYLGSRINEELIVPPTDTIKLGDE